MNIIIAGGGLAGCEAAFCLANRGYKVDIYEMRPKVGTPAHVSGDLAELVCSNSLKSVDTDTAAGLLKKELELFSGVLMQVAEATRVPAGSALAVDRERFSTLATKVISGHKNITVVREELKSIPKSGNIILACGPLASDSITREIFALTGGGLFFVDAISPVISAESIDFSKGYFAGRYNKGGDDYFNLPMEKEEFELFYSALKTAETVKPHDFEDERVFEKCMPIEVIAGRGEKTLLFGPMRPVGLEHPDTGKRPYAVVQLRFENKDKTAFNIVGFQTKMKIPEQRRVLRLIPGLENAEFLRYGTIHRNTYIDAPAHLALDQSFRISPHVFLAGQITGVEGYLESMASGIIAAIQLDRKLNGKPAACFSPYTAFGALQSHIKGEFGDKVYTPGNFHFGMLPPPDVRIRKKSERKEYYSKRALDIYTNQYLAELGF